MSDSQPQRRQPTRLHRPWDSPGKNTGVGCHFLLQCMKVKSESEVAQSCSTLSDPMDWSLPGSSIHGIFQARVLEWGAITFSVTLLIYLLFVNIKLLYIRLLWRWMHIFLSLVAFEWNVWTNSYLNYHHTPPSPLSKCTVCYTADD